MPFRHLPAEPLLAPENGGATRPPGEPKAASRLGYVADDPLIGRVLSQKYRVVRLIGRGGMGRVYEAEHQRLGKKCALKVLSADLEDDGSLRERFLWEPRMASEFDHPNIIRVSDVDEDDGRLYIVMDLIEGSDLRALLRNGPLSPDRALRIVGQAAAALDHAHARGLIHRDVKPANILVGGGDHVVLTDFGLAKSANRIQSLTVTGGFFGSISYAAAEQFDARGAEPASDRYALGCVLWECLTGKAPFAGYTDLEIIRGHLGPAAPRMVGNFPTPALDDVFAKALAKDPLARYATAQDMVDAAATALAEETREQTRAAPKRPERPPTEPIERSAAAPPVPVPAAGALDDAALSRATARYPRSDERPPVVVPPGPETPSAAQRLERMLRRPVALAAVALPIAAVGGVVLGASTGSTKHLSTTTTVTQPAPKAKTITANGLTLTLPATWRSRALPPSLATAAKRPGVYLSSTAYPNRFLAVFVPRAKPWLPPGATAHAARAVKLGTRQALRLARVEARLGKGTQSEFVMTPYVTSTTRGDVVIACGRIPASSADTSKTPLETSFAQECERLASTLRIRGARPLALLPLAAGVASVRKALATLSDARGRENANLGSATRVTQIAAASRLATSYETAKSQVSRLRPALGIRRARAHVLVDLHAESLAFMQLFSAGTSGSAQGWTNSANAVKIQDGQLLKDLTALDAALAGKAYALGS
jgi:serine/threonine protein kinase